MNRLSGCLYSKAIKIIVYFEHYSFYMSSVRRKQQTDQVMNIHLLARNVGKHHWFSSVETVPINDYGMFQEVLRCRNPNNITPRIMSEASWDREL